MERWAGIFLVGGGGEVLAEMPANCQKSCFGTVPYSMMATSKSYQAKNKRLQK